jgi:hypothetical protein
VLISLFIIKYPLQLLFLWDEAVIVPKASGERKGRSERGKVLAARKHNGAQKRKGNFQPQMKHGSLKGVNGGNREGDFYLLTRALMGPVSISNFT